MKIAQVALAISIAVLYVSFFAYGTYVVYPGPTDCEWREVADPVDREGVAEWDGAKEEYDSCMTVYEPLRERYYLNNVAILGVLAIGSIILGLYLSTKYNAIGSGILGGGVLLLLYTVIRFWGDMSKWLRLGVLGTGLVVVLVIGYLKIEEIVHKK